jgi:cytochrome bd-type quinol oxidase subunit 2
MLLILIALPLIALGFILYFAVSKKSSPPVRRLAVIALILAVITLIVSVIFVVVFAPFQDAESGPAAFSLPVGPVTPGQKMNWLELVIFSLLFVLFFVFIFALSRRSSRGRGVEDRDSRE